MTSKHRRAATPMRRLYLTLRFALVLSIALLSVPFLNDIARAEDGSAAPADPGTTSTESAPSDPASSDPAPADSAPADPAPAPEPAPSDPAPVADQPATDQPTTGGSTAPGPKTATSSSGSSLTSSPAAAETTTSSSSCAAVFRHSTTKVHASGHDYAGLPESAWIAGNLVSGYAEGDYVPQRVALSGVPVGVPQTLVFTYDRTISANYAYDFMADLQMTGGTATWDAAPGNPPMPFATEVLVTITFTASTSSPTLYWEAHVASELDYLDRGLDLGAGDIAGSNYHLGLKSLSCGNVGTQTNQMKTSAVDAGKITVVKDARPDSPQDFEFTITAPNASNDTRLDDDADPTLSNETHSRVAPGNVTVRETPVAGWTLSSITCTVAAINQTGGTPVTPVAKDLADGSVTVAVADDKNVTCTFVNTREARVQVDKVWKINGETYADGAAQAAYPQLGLTSQLSLTGPAPAGASNQAWGAWRGGYSQGESTTISETSGSANALCGPVSAKVTRANGAAVDQALPWSPTLQGGDNSYTVTNTVDCRGHVTLVKVVDNGPAVATAWTLSATASGGGMAGPSGTTGSPGASGDVTAGAAYVLSETGGDSRYVQNGAWACTNGVTVTDHTVRVEAGRSTTCTVHNATARVTVVKDVVNDDGGTATPGRWTLHAGDHAGTNGSSFWVTPGEALALGESGGPSGYTRTSIVCSNIPGTAVTSVTPAAGAEVTCTFTNDDDAAALSLNKIVDNGSTGAGTDASAFTLTATPQPAIAGQDPVSGPGGFTATEVKAGTYLLGERGPDGYDPGSWSCSGGSLGGTPGAQTVTVANGGSASCTITNTARQPFLTLDKTVLGNEQTGGTASDGDFELRATGPVTVHGFEGDDGDTDVTGVPVPVGTYTLEELGGPHGYAQVGEWWCGADHPVDAQHRVQLGLGDNVTCTVQNQAQAPHLTLLKKVAGNDATGGTAVDTDWTLSASGPVTVSGVEGDASITGASVKKGTYVLAESGGPSGYTQTGWHCWGGGVQGVDVHGKATITIALGEDVTCTVVNTAQQPHLTLGKTVDNGDTGGTAVDTDWTLTATGPVTVSGVEGDASITGAPVPVGTYALAESDGPHGYHQVGWQCTGGTLGTGPKGETTVTVPLGADVSCTVTNAAEQGTLTLAKTVDPNGTGVVEPDTAWTLMAASGTYAISGVEGQSAITGAAVPAGTYLLSEANGPGGWEQVGWVCADGKQGTDDQGRPTVTVKLGQAASCTVTNRAVASTWAVTKHNDRPRGATVTEGEVITYTVTATKTSDGVAVLDATVTDDLSGILPDKGSIVPGSITVTSGAQPTLVGAELHWTIPVLGSTPQTMTYQVLVGDRHGVTLRNHATGDGAEPCEAGNPDCTTENPTPHYLLDKSVAFDDADGDGLAMPGQELTYTLTLRNDTVHAVVRDTVVTDDVSDVLDDATMASTTQELAGQGLVLDDSVIGSEHLTWTVTGPVAPGATVTATYRVTVDDGAWGRQLVNTATPDRVGDCVGADEPGDECTTTTGTNPVTTLVVKKVDLEDSSESPAGLPGAEFALYRDNAPYADPADPQIGDEDEELGVRTTDADGLAKWGELLKGHYLLQETRAPEGYDLPEATTLAVEVDDGNFVAGGEMAPIVFRDAALGDLIITKGQQELEGTSWVESDGIVNHGDVLKYTLHVSTLGLQRFHDVVVTDYVPNRNPADDVSTGASTLVPDSAVCLGEFEAVCSVGVDADGLITWKVGDLQGRRVDLEFVVRFPDLPDEVHYDRHGEYRTVLWNVAYADWAQAVGGSRDGLEYQYLSAVSNEVIAEAVVQKPGEPVEPPPPVQPPGNPPHQPTQPQLPSTGAPENLLQLALLGALAVGLGVALAARGRRRDEEESPA
ncbi:hypothetical protein EKO23_12590 [Nocardioides guangzhouensis]|uniref:DUF11 domain-containing protein n=1 Tax=Nocardioides guangzhouensis TaxID=2497878 RepID=A0A4Q4ZBG6_9ACTN|nr:SpaA isopeptide-forming pilin-related protein [Nocardioides guangzhouensis]RYP85317.1 hypothetical protein EKO23_12590 [Nocardioides guangzhouensis]